MEIIKDKIQIAIPVGSTQMDNRLCGWLFAVKQQSAKQKPELKISHMQPVDANRNLIVKSFLCASKSYTKVCRIR